MAEDIELTGAAAHAAAAEVSDGRRPEEEGGVPASPSGAVSGTEAPASDERDPFSVSGDGSPHGPLGLYDDDEEGGLPAAPESGIREGSVSSEDGSADAEEAAGAPMFASFHGGAMREPADLEKRSAGVPAAGTPGVPAGGDDDDEFAEDDAPMTLIGHLNELRRRLTRIVIVALLGFVAFYGVSEQIYAWLSEPLKACLPEGSKLIYTSPQGAFFTYMKVALVASLFGTSPFSFYQVWAFIAPGLYREEKRAVLPLALFSTVFFLSGAAFCFYLVFPIAFQFFMGFATDTIVPMISVEEYLSFALKLLIAFGLVFEMPLFTFFLSKFGILSPDFMRRSRRYAILLIFILAAILTPPDVFSQCMMAGPMLLLYEVSIYVSAIARPKEKSEDDDGEKSGAENNEQNGEEQA